MTRRERLEQKIVRRSEWAQSATAKASQAFATSQVLVAGIPMGQPILVGHHSEKRHRRALDRSWNALGRSVELTHKAEMHESKAANLGAALERTIFSDDDNAVEAIEQRIAEREAQRETMKARNSAYRKRDDTKLTQLTGYGVEWWDAKLADAYPWCKQPHPAYELQNLGGRITADKKRLEAIKRQNARRDAAAATENGVTITNHSNAYTSVTFAEKPDYSIIRALKEAGFRWGSGSWFGQTEKLPESVRVLA